MREGEMDVLCERGKRLGWMSTLSCFSLRRSHGSHGKLLSSVPIDEGVKVEKEEKEGRSHCRIGLRAEEANVKWFRWYHEFDSKVHRQTLHHSFSKRGQPSPAERKAMRNKAEIDRARDEEQKEEGSYHGRGRGSTTHVPHDDVNPNREMERKDVLVPKRSISYSSVQQFTTRVVIDQTIEWDLGL
jgi:hypothetical protein